MERYSTFSLARFFSLILALTHDEASQRINSPGAREHVCQWKPERLHLAVGDEIFHTFRNFRYQMEERCAEEDTSAEAEQEAHSSRRSVGTAFDYLHTYLANSVVLLSSWGILKKRYR